MDINIRKKHLESLVLEELEEVLFEDFYRENRDSLREAYIDQNGEMDEGIVDFAKQQYGKLKTKGIKKYASDLYAGVKDIGFKGRGSTLLGGEEIIDIEDRNAKRGQAEQELKQILDSINSQRLKDIKAELDDDGFPNQEYGFETSINLIKDEYETIVREFKEGKIDAGQANSLIAGLRDIVIYFQDFKISDKYLYINENINEAEQGAQAKNVASAYANKLPMGLLIGGASLVGLGYAAENSDFFKSILEKLKTVESADPKAVADVITDEAIKKGEGFTQVANRITGVDLSSNAPAGNLKDPKVASVFRGIADVLRNPQLGGKDVIEKVITEPEKYGKTVAEVFAKLAKGTELKTIDPKAAAVKQLMIDPGKFKMKVAGAVQKVATGQTKKSLWNFILEKAKWMTGPMIAALGAGMIGAAGVSAALRAKGKRSSRMATLKKLVDSMLDVSGEGKGEPAGEPAERPDDETTSTGLARTGGAETALATGGEETGLSTTTGKDTGLGQTREDAGQDFIEDLIKANISKVKESGWQPVFDEEDNMVGIKKGSTVFRFKKFVKAAEQNPEAVPEIVGQLPAPIQQPLLQLAAKAGGPYEMPVSSLAPAIDADFKELPDEEEPAQGKTVDEMLADLKTKLESSEQLKAMTGGNNNKIKILNKLIDLAITRIKEQLKEKNYEPGDEVTLSEASKSINLDIFNSLFKGLVGRKGDYVYPMAKEILSALAIWADSVGFKVDKQSLNTVQDTQPKPKAKGEAPAATEQPPAVLPKNDVVPPENITVGSEPVKKKDAAKKAKEAAGKANIKITIGTDSVVAKAPAPVDSKDMDALAKVAKTLKADPEEVKKDIDARPENPVAVAAPTNKQAAKRMASPKYVYTQVNEPEKKELTEPGSIALKTPEEKRIFRQKMGEKINPIFEKYENLRIEDFREKLNSHYISGAAIKLEDVISSLNALFDREIAKLEKQPTQEAKKGRPKDDPDLKQSADLTPQKKKELLLKFKEELIAAFEDLYADYQSASGEESKPKKRTVKKPGERLIAPEFYTNKMKDNDEADDDSDDGFESTEEIEDDEEPSERSDPYAESDEDEEAEMNAKVRSRNYSTKKMSESFDFKARFMKLAGILKG
jgi:hypothetical protein